MRILLTEDDPRLGPLLVQGLERAGWAVDLVGGVEEALAALRAVRYRALVLDLGLPDGDGMEVLRELRRNDTFLPVIILTARGRLSERVQGLNGGADDYLVKPFALEELVARLAAACRRGDTPAPQALRLGRVALEPAARTFSVDGTVQPLPRREMMVLELLLRGRHRRRLLIKVRRDVAVQPILREWLSRVRVPNSVKVQLDVDPVSFL